MSDIFISELDGGAFAQTNNGDIATDSGLQSPAYCLLLGGRTPLDVLQGRDPDEPTFEEVMDAKVSVQNMARQEAVGTKKLETLVTQGLCQSATVRVVNTGIERLEVYTDFILLGGSPVSNKIAVFENGVMV